MSAKRYEVGPWGCFKGVKNASDTDIIIFRDFLEYAENVVYIHMACLW